MATARETFVELGDDAMIVDCDVAAMEQLLLAGHFDEAGPMRSTVEARLDSAVPPVVIAFERTVGRLDVLVGDVEAGRRHLERALDSAREHRLLYDECLCLRAIVAAADGVAGWLPEETVERVRAEHEALVQRLGMVRR
jgi:hypothetical protein